MENRNPVMVFLLSIITLGIYALVWFVQTKDEMNAKGANIPTAWLLIIPIAGFYWMWKYSEGVGLVTNGKMEAWVTFVLLFFISIIGMLIIQDAFNKVSTE